MFIFHLELSNYWNMHILRSAHNSAIIITDIGNSKRRLPSENDCSMCYNLALSNQIRECVNSVSDDRTCIQTSVNGRWLCISCESEWLWESSASDVCVCVCVWGGGVTEVKGQGRSQKMIWPHTERRVNFPSASACIRERRCGFMGVGSCLNLLSFFLSHVLLSNSIHLDLGCKSLLET